jgi:hypothetical protein
MTLLDYCKYLGWSGLEFSRRAGINPRTARKALAQKPVAGHVATKIAETLSAALEKQIRPGDIDGLTTRR